MKKTIKEGKQEKYLQGLIDSVVRNHRMQVKLLYKIFKSDVEFSLKNAELRTAIDRTSEEIGRLSHAASNIYARDNDLHIQNLNQIVRKGLPYE
jgi:hypothetical protein